MRNLFDRLKLTCVLLGLLLHSGPAHVMMAGAPPDSPAARVDPNTAGSTWTGVGSVVVSGGTYSGVVVAPQFVLTAAHVVGSAAPAAVQFVLNYGGDQTHTIQAESIARYPSASFPYDDLALIRLVQPVPPGVRIYPLWREGIAPGQRIVIVGYGASGSGTTGVSVAAARTVKRGGQNTIDLVQTTVDSSGRSSLFYLYDFDGPTGSGPFGGATLGNSIETLVAGGDSGSPAFVVESDGTRLVGINTFVTTTSGTTIDYRFGTIGGGMLLPRPEFLAWIDTTTGYTTVDTSTLDVPTLPQWAVVCGMISLVGVAWKRLRPTGYG